MVFKILDNFKDGNIGGALNANAVLVSDVSPCLLNLEIDVNIQIIDDRISTFTERYPDS